VSALSLIFLSLVFTPFAGGDGPDPKACLSGVNAPPAGIWKLPANATVSIYFLRGSFSTGDEAVMSSAVDEWNLTLAENGSAVKINTRGDIDSAPDCAVCITVMRGNTFQNGRRLAELRPQLIAGTHEIFSGRIVIDQGVTNPVALKSVMVHEMGHMLGIDDCPSCPRGTTIMALYKGLNKSNGLDHPSGCDKSAVVAGYLKK
jgi:hypothetical protein